MVKAVGRVDDVRETGVAKVDGAWDREGIGVTVVLQWWGACDRSLGLARRGTAEGMRLAGDYSLGVH